MRSYLRALPRPNRVEGFSLIEILVATFISSVIFAAIFMVLNMGEFSSRIGSAKLDATQEARRALDWMMRDFRQTSRMQMNVTGTDGNVTSFAGLGGTDVTFSTPEFNLCLGFTPATGSAVWSANQISYVFDAVNRTVSRIDSAANTPLRFNHINNLAFTKIGLNELRVDIRSQRGARGGTGTGEILQTFTLREEISLRNE